MAAVSVKGSIEQTHNYGVFAERRLDCMARFSLLSFYDYIPKLTNVTNNLYGRQRFQCFVIFSSEPLRCALLLLLIYTVINHNKSDFSKIPVSITLTKRG